MATTTLNRTVTAALHADAEAHPHEIAESALFDIPESRPDLLDGLLGVEDQGDEFLDLIRRPPPGE